MQTLAILCLIGFTLAGESLGLDYDLYPNNDSSAIGSTFNEIIVAVSHKMIYGDGHDSKVFINFKKGTYLPLKEDPTTDYKEGDRFFFFPDPKGKLQKVDSWAPIDELSIKSFLDNKYLLYTRKNPHEPQFLVNGDVKKLRKSFFDPDKETVFFSHGWLGDGYTDYCQNIKEAFLYNKDVNVIVLDWSELAKLNYVTATCSVPKVGKLLGKFIIWLTSQGLKYERIHLVGFSLGGHVVGNAGRATGGKVRRITSLDPAGPLWTFNSNRIVKTDGQYVEVIHTNTALAGYKFSCGDADFYPNGGFIMPGCFSNSCSHRRAVEYMASTVKFNHLEANEYLESSE